MTFRHFGCVAALLLCSPALFAQTPITVACGAAAPVSLEVVPVKAGDAAAVATIKNKDTRPISVVFLSWKLTDSMRNSENEVTILDLSLAGTLATNQTTTDDVSLPTEPNKPITAISVSCAAVLFSDGDFWGRGNMPEVVRFLARRSGIRFERDRLLKIYETQGADQVIAELKRPLPR